MTQPWYNYPRAFDREDEMPAYLGSTRGSI